MPPVLLAALLALLPACGGLAAGGAREGLVRARLVAGDAAVPGARVRAVLEPGVGFGEREYLSLAEGGEALLRLPPGSYYLAAFSPDEAVFGYYGPNPVQVRPGEELYLSIRGVAGNAPPRPRPVPAGGGVEGVVTGEDGALEGAVVAFYLDATSQFRGPAYAEVLTDAEGRFETPLSPGRYYLVARRRAGGEERHGPLSVGDHFGYYAFNPLLLTAGETVEVRIGAVEVLRRTGWKGPTVLRTRLSGRVTDAQGRGLEGYRVFLHSRREMLGKPEFVSGPSGPDGLWELWAEKEGTFYLGARRSVGTAREEGEAVGTLAGSADGALEVRMDGREMTGLAVVVEAGATR